MTEPNDAVDTPAAGKRGKGKDQATEAKRAEQAAQLTAEIARIDRILTGAVLLLAFLLASFMVRNSDYWLHLALGRSLVEGKYAFGVDPFAYTTQGAYWVNHSWLYDLLLYGFTMLAGGPFSFGGVLAVVLKALAFTGLAAVLLKLRRPDQGRYVPAACVGLAILAMAPRMTLQPIAVSLLFLGLTLYFLAREGKADPTGVRGLRLLTTSAPQRLWVLPVLFALWSNLDQWFILGPATLGLYLLGEMMQQSLAPDAGPDAPKPGEQRTLTRVLLVGLAACVLNPHHVRVFSLPVELLPTMRLHGYVNDTRFAALFVSPFEKIYFTPAFGLHVTGIAYFPLLLVGVASFWLTRDQWRAWRLLVWTAFAGLSAANMLLVPFFAVVAGPIAALNFQDYAATRVPRKTPPGPRFLRVMLSSRLLTLTLAAILILATWPGFLGANAGNMFLARRVAWGVEIDPSLRKVTDKLEVWRLNSKLRPEDNGFNFIPEIANYCAWFCPDEKGFLDGRYGLFAGAATTYTDVRNALDPMTLRPGAPRPPAGAVPDWQQILRDYSINHVIINNGWNKERTAHVVNRLLADPQQWVPLYLDGRTAVFGWRDPKKRDADSFAGMRLDRGADAFGKLGVAETAPRAGPGPAPLPPTWWDRYLLTPAPLPLDADAAAMNLLYFDSIRRQRAQHHEREWAVLTSVRAIGNGNPAAGGGVSAASFVGTGYLGIPLRGSYLSDFEAAPPDVLLLGVRAARNAVAQNPQDVEACFALARATDALWSFQENHLAPGQRLTGLTPAELIQMLRDKKNPEPRLSPWLTPRSLSTRQVLRRVQVLTALHRILALQPDAPMVHHYLFNIYWSMSYYDVAVEHLREEVRLLHSLGPRLMDVKELEANLKQREGLLADCEKQLNEVQRNFEFAAAGRPSKVQALGAFRPFGLAKQSLDALMKEDLAQLTRDEANLVIWLHLTLGKAEALRGVLGEQHKAVLEPLHYEIHRAVQSGAMGDYADADGHLEQALKALPPPDRAPLASMLQSRTFGQLLPPGLPQRLLEPFLEDQFLGAHLSFMVQRQFNDLQVLRGILALEVGDTEKAAKHFAEALDDPRPRYDFEAKPIAQRYLELIRAHGK